MDKSLNIGGWVKLRSIGSLVLVALLGCSTGSSDDKPTFILAPRWANQQRVPTASHLRAVRFASPTQGFVAGHDTSLYRTDDGGLSWRQEEHEPFNRGGDILGLDFLGLEIKAVGVDAQGVGRTWTSMDALNWTTPSADLVGAPFVSVDVTPSIFGAPPNLTWALRENWTISVTNSAGFLNESANLPPPPALKATAIDMIYSGAGYVVGEGGKIFETTSHGNPIPDPDPLPPDDSVPAWIDRSDPGMTNHLRAVQLIEAGTVFACGDNGTLVWTESGGGLVAIPGTPAGTWRGLHFIHTFQGTSTGWLVGDGGQIRKVNGTYSAGAWTWVWAPVAASGTAEPLYSVHFADKDNGYAVGDDGAVVKTTNGGTSWTNLTSGRVDTINAVCFEPSGVIGVAVGDDGWVYKTLNGGSFWSATLVGSEDWTAVSIPAGNFNVAYICGPTGDIARNINLTTGNAWQTSTDPDIPNVTLRGIHFPQSGDVGFAVGDGGTILYTNSGTGLFDWAPVASAPASNYMAVTSELRGGGLGLYAAGSNGVIAESDLNGYALAWTLLASGVPATWGAGETVTAIQAPLPTLLFAALDDGGGQRLHRRAAGFWLPVPSQPSPTPPTAAGLAFVGQSFGWWVGDKIYTTENGANAGVPDWKVSPTHTKSTFKGIWMNQAGTIGYVVGTNGAILKTATGGK